MTIKICLSLMGLLLLTNTLALCMFPGSGRAEEIIPYSRPAQLISKMFWDMEILKVRLTGVREHVLLTEKYINAGLGSDFYSQEEKARLQNLKEKISAITEKVESVEVEIKKADVNQLFPENIKKWGIVIEGLTSENDRISSELFSRLSSSSQQGESSAKK